MNRIIYFIVYVDDFLIVAKEDKDIEEVAKLLRKHFQLTNLGTFHHYLGIQVKRENGIYTISQSQYIDKVLRNVGLPGTNWGITIYCS